MYRYVTRCTFRAYWIVKQMKYFFTIRMPYLTRKVIVDVLVYQNFRIIYLYNEFHILSIPCCQVVLNTTQ